jgi:hypothetical protein
MRRRFQGLAATAQPNTEVPDGVFLVRVDQVRYSRERQKPLYTVRFSVVEPELLAGRTFSGRLYCRRRPCGSSLSDCLLAAHPRKPPRLER